MSADSTTTKVEALRRAFDDGFTKEQQTSFEPIERLVAVRVGADAFAIRIAEIASVHAAGTVTALPEGPPGLLGLAGIRGQIAVVWDLATLLGYPDAGGTRRWLALTAMQRDVALALAHVEGYLRIETRRFREVSGRDSVGGQLQQAFEHEGALRRVVSVPTVLANLRRAIGRGAAP